MGDGLPNLCGARSSNILWSENGPCWGTIAYLLVGKEGQFYITSYISLSFHSFFEFYINEEGKRPWWIILREEGEFLLHYLYIDGCTWLCNMCLICKHWHLTENGKIPRFWVFVLSVWRWTIVVSYLQEMVFENSPSDHENMIYLMPFVFPCRLYIHLNFTYSVGPPSVV